MWSNIAFAICLLVISMTLILRQRQAWTTAQQEGLHEREHNYLYHQHRRRTRASVLIGVVGLAILGGIWVTEPRAMLVYWSGVTLMVVWMGCLALADLVNTRAYFKQVYHDRVSEHRAIRAELDRLRSREGNGRQTSESGEPKQDDEDV